MKASNYELFGDRAVITSEIATEEDEALVHQTAEYVQQL